MTGTSTIHPLFEFISRVIAFLSSVILAIVLLIVLILTNINDLTASFPESIGNQQGLFLRIGHSSFHWKTNTPVLSLQDIEARSSRQENQFGFAAKSIDIKVSQPFWTRTGPSFEYIKVENPEILGKLSMQRSSVAGEVSLLRQGDWASGINISALTAVKSLQIENGHYDFDVSSSDSVRKFAGTFNVENNSYGDRFEIFGNVKSDIDPSSNTLFSIDLLAPPDKDPSADLQLRADAFKLSGLGIFLPSSNIEFETLETVADVNLKGHWNGQQLQNIEWSVTARDPKLAGTHDQAEETVLTSDGSWRLNDDGRRAMQAEFSLVDLDAMALFDQHGDNFPPNFRKHISERLRSLRIIRAEGQISGDPKSMFRVDGDKILNFEGEFENYAYRYAKRWPMVEQGSGKFRVQGNKVVISGEKGSIAGQPIEFAEATIEDFTVADPILSFVGQIVVPMNVAESLFGRNGTVSSGKTQNIKSGTGGARVTVNSDVPLRRGKEFTLSGIVQPAGLSLVTTQDIEITDIKGQVSFNRNGLGSGDLSGSTLGGEVEMQLQLLGAKENYVVTGNVNGNVDSKYLGSILGSEVASALSGSFNWQADFELVPNESTIEFSTDLAGLESKLPFPMTKNGTEKWPLNVDMVTKNRSEREISLQLIPFVSSTMSLRRQEDRWITHSGNFAIGESKPTPKRKEGAVVSIHLPIVDYQAWNEIFKNSKKQLTNNDLKSGIGFTESLQELTVSADTLIFSRNRRIDNASIHAAKTKDQWKLSIQSDKISGEGEYKNWDLLKEGEKPRLSLNLSKCFFPKAESEAAKSVMKPENMPFLRFECRDTQYGKYYLGSSVIVGEPNKNDWNLVIAEFRTPTTQISAVGKWEEQQKSSLKFEVSSTEFGQSMDDLGFANLFRGGDAKLSGEIEWDSALMNLEPESTSGSIEFTANHGSLLRFDSVFSKVIGFLNYDSLLRKIDVNAQDVLAEGLAFERISGNAQVEKGMIEIPGIYIDSPSAKIVMQGETDWVARQHNLKAGVEPEVGKSVTTIATLINPVTGLLTYFGKNLIEDIGLFEVQYDITGSWDEPKIKAGESSIPQKDNKADR